MDLDRSTDGDFATGKVCLVSIKTAYNFLTALTTV